MAISSCLATACIMIVWDKYFVRYKAGIQCNQDHAIWNWVLVNILCLQSQYHVTVTCYCPYMCVWLWNMAPLLITHVRCQMQDGPVLKACVHECAIIWNVELAIGCLCFVQYTAATFASVKTCPRPFIIQATLIERIVPWHTAVNFARTNNDPSN